jgi:nitrite reductase/ring-hydroxylating ferredoxin subunit
MPCHDCLNRREFIALAASGAAAATLTACGDIAVPLPAHLDVVVGNFPGLATIGQLVKVGPSHAAKRTGTNTFDAFSMRCTHAGCTTTIVTNSTFDCPCHGSTFDNNGLVTSGPANKDLPKLTATYNPGTDTLSIN